MTSDLLTIAEAARVAGISRMALIQAMNRGTLPFETVKVKQRRLKREDVLAHVRRTKRRPCRPPPA